MSFKWCILLVTQFGDFSLKYTVKFLLFTFQTFSELFTSFWLANSTSLKLSVKNSVSAYISSLSFENTRGKRIYFLCHLLIILEWLSSGGLADLMTPAGFLFLRYFNNSCLAFLGTFTYFLLIANLYVQFY